MLQITCCWGIFYTLYWFFFRKETFFRLNRFYLLGTLLLGVIIPQLDVAFFNENSPLANANYLQTVTVGVENLAAAIVITPENSGNGFQWNWQLILKGIYGIGVAFFSIKFLLGLWKIFDLFKNSNKTQHIDYQLIENKNIKIPFSFFNLLFWNKNLEQTDPDYPKILQHERAHIRQWHSLDVLILEIMTILFWWNPLVWFYKKSLRTIHEYLADDAVLQTTKKKQYGQLLIRQSHSGMQVALANNFIQSQLKNRIMMMMKSKSQSQQLWKYLMILPVFGILFLTFSCENATAQSEKETVEANLSGPGDEVYKVVEEMPRFAGTDLTGLTTETEKQDASNKLLLEHIYTNVTYPKNAREQGVQGVTVVQFVIGKTGKLRDFKIVRSVGEDVDAEALRVAKTMPDWIPGRQGGKAVAVQFNLPIKFKLEDDKGLPHKNYVDYQKGIFNFEVDEMPYFPGCNEATIEGKRNCSDQKMLGFIYSNIKYPKTAQAENAEGMVIVKFVVEKDGRLTNPKIKKSVHPKCDEEVLRIVNEMPIWEPAVKDGKNVAVEFTLPVKFKLEGEKQEETTTQKVENQPKELDIRDFKAFPNPASDKLTIQLTTREKQLNVTLIDAAGKVIEKAKTVETPENSTMTWSLDDVDVSEAARGMMLIQIETLDGKKKITEKVILQ